MSSAWVERGEYTGAVWYAMIVLILMPNAGEEYDDAERSMSCDVVWADNRYVLGWEMPEKDGPCPQCPKRRHEFTVENVARPRRGAYLDV